MSGGGAPADTGVAGGGALRRRLVVVALIVGAVSGVGLLLAGPASAHATVVGSSPTDGSRLKAVPAQVTISFDEAVGLAPLGYLTVTDETGHLVSVGAAFHPNGTGSVIAAKLKSGLGDGTYTESYRVISADSHPVAGVVRFVVGNGAFSETTVNVSTVNHGTSTLFDLVRWVSYAGFALLGGAWLLLSIWPEGRSDRRALLIVRSGWIAVTAGAIVETFIQGPYAAGEGIGKIASWPLLDATLHTDYGQWHCVRLLLLGLLAGVPGVELIRRPSDTERSGLDDVAWLLMIGVALTFSLVGHAQTTNPAWLSITADTVHLCSMAAWVGGLALLIGAIMPRRDVDELAVVLPVFSRVAFTCVVLLAVTGLYAAWRGVGMLRAIFTTEYGLLVDAKVVLFIGLIALGNLSRVAVNRRATGDAAGSAFSVVTLERMRRSVTVELGVAAIVLVATAVLVDQPRGREAIAVSDAKPVSGVANLTDGRTATIIIDPGKHGTVTVNVDLSPGAEPKSITATALQQAKQIGPLPLTLSPNGTDEYSASNVDLPVSGHWIFALVVTESQFDAISTNVTIKLH